VIIILPLLCVGILFSTQNQYIMSILMKVILVDTTTNEELKNIALELDETSVVAGLDGIEESCLKAFGTIHSEVSECLLSQQQSNYLPVDKKKTALDQ